MSDIYPIRTIINCHNVEPYIKGQLYELPLYNQLMAISFLHMLNLSRADDLEETEEYPVVGELIGGEFLVVEFGTFRFSVKLRFPNPSPKEGSSDASQP